MPTKKKMKKETKKDISMTVFISSTSKYERHLGNQLFCHIFLCLARLFITRFSAAIAYALLIKTIVVATGKYNNSETTKAYA